MIWAAPIRSAAALRIGTFGPYRARSREPPLSFLMTAVNRVATRRHIDELLEQAAGFARGGDPTGAVARAHWARKELASHGAAFAGDDWAAEGLRAQVKYATREYEHLLQDWQRQNAVRQTAYVKRERAAIGASPDAQPGSPAGNVRQATWRSRALSAVRRAFTGRSPSTEDAKLRAAHRGDPSLRS
jgi:hypothetical protein